jgi:catechol 2,3-dioxygenase-like lactoylglutathione lyase family enzyme
VALHRLTKIVIGVPDVASATDFYVDFGLESLKDGRFATSDGGEQLALIHRERRGLVELGIGCDDADDIARVAARLDGSGLAHRQEGEELLCADPGSGITVRLQPALRYVQTAAVADPVNGPGRVDRPNVRAPGTERTGTVRPHKLGHVVLGSTDVEASERLFLDILGFEVSDTIRNVGKFMRCSTDHHNLMVSQAPGPFLHHTSWEVDDVDEVGRGAAQVVAKDPTRHAWGLGRHNVGGNFFWYVRDPAGNYAEYYSDLDIITEELRWEKRTWGARDGIAAWGPPHPHDFFRPDDVAELMMRGA